MTSQIDVLRRLAGDERVKTYLEVGVQEGKSLEAVCLAAASRLDHVALCDTWESVSGGSGRGSHDHIIQLLAGLPASPALVTYLDGDSRTVLPTLSCAFDLVHIDGGHSFDAVRSDLEHGWRCCSKWMVVHDISFSEVWQAFFAFASQLSWRHKVECHFGGHGTAVVTRESVVH